MNSFKPATRRPLDSVGQYYASVICPDYPGNYTISVYLKQPIQPDALQQASDDLFRRLPFLNSKLIEGERYFEHEILENPPKIVQDVKGAPFTAYYSEGEGHVVRVLYGENHFTVEVTHFIIDGRSTTNFARALLVRYLEVLGIKVSKSDIIDCSDTPDIEEYEDAFERYAETAKEYKKEKSKEKHGKAYHHEGSTPTATNVTLLKFDLPKIKAAAKRYETTINIYVMAHLFEVIAKERDAGGIKKPITAMMPIDCRGFLPSKSFRNFVTAKTIAMPENVDFKGKIKGLQEQLSGINTEFILKEINEEMRDMPADEDLPPIHVMKKEITEMTIHEYEYITTTFSNLGLVKFPIEAEAFIDFMDFTISQEGRPYSFGCISTGNVLTIAATASVTGDSIIENLKKRLEDAG